MKKTTYYSVILFIALLILKFTTQTCSALDIEGATNACQSECITYKVIDGNGGPYHWVIDKGLPAFTSGKEVTICWKGNDTGNISLTDLSNQQQITKAINIYETPQTELDLETNPIACEYETECGGAYYCGEFSSTSISNVDTLGTLKGQNCFEFWGEGPYSISFSDYFKYELNAADSFILSLYSEPTIGEVEIIFSSDDTLIVYTPPSDFTGIITFNMGFGLFKKNGSGHTDISSFHFIINCDYNYQLGQDISVTNCAKVCKNSLETYSVLFKDGNTYQWMVEGAENFVPDNEKAAIQWGDAGIGLIKILEENPNGCQDSLIFCVEILEGTSAVFQTNPPTNNGILNACSGQTVYFENMSSNAEEYFWDFGDGYFSDDFDAQHIYETSGQYTVQLITGSDCACRDTSSIVVLVEDALVPEITCLGTVCQNMQNTYYADANCNTFYWTVSDEGNIVDGGGNNDDFVTVEWTTGYEGSISLQTENCNGDYCSLPITAKIPILSNNAISIQGDMEVCEKVYAYYEVPFFDATEYYWEISGLGLIKEGQGSNHIQVYWPSDSTSTNQTKVVKVSYENCYLECGGQAELEVNFKPNFTVNVRKDICNNGIMSASAFEESNLDDVQCDWHLITPDGTKITDFQTNTASFEANIPAGYDIGSYSLEAVPINSSNFCNKSIVQYFNVHEAPMTPTDIIGTKFVCPGKTYNYQVVVPEQTGKLLLGRERRNK